MMMMRRRRRRKRRKKKRRRRRRRRREEGEEEDDDDDDDDDDDHNVDSDEHGHGGADKAADNGQICGDEAPRPVAGESSSSSPEAAWGTGNFSGTVVNTGRTPICRLVLQVLHAGDLVRARA
jgi:hypothetical protein